MPAPAADRTATPRRGWGRISHGRLIAVATVAVLLAVFATGNVGQTYAYWSDTASGHVLSAQAGSIKAIHAAPANNTNFSAGVPSKLDAVTVTNTGTIAADFTTTTAVAATTSSLRNAISVLMWPTTTASGCSTPVNPVSGIWGASTLKVTGPLPAGASIVICVRTTLSDLVNQTSGESLTASVNTLLGRSTWTSSASSPIYQKYVDLPPSTPTGLTSMGATGATLNLSWAASSDDIAVTGYDVYSRNATGTWVKVGTGASTAYTVSGLASDTTYTFSVVARDGAGHSSSMATPLTVKTLDVTAPTWSTTPALTGSLSGTTATLTWTPATDVRGIAKYEVFNGPTKVGEILNPNAALTKYTLAHSGLVAGTTYSYTVRALDPSGNSLTSNVVPLTVPVPLLSCVDSGWSVDATIAWTKPAGASGSRTYEILVNDVVVGIVTSSATAPEYVLTRDRLDAAGITANGTYTAQVRLQGQTAPLFQRTVVLTTVRFIFNFPAVRCD